MLEMFFGDIQTLASLFSNLSRLLTRLSSKQVPKPSTGLKSEYVKIPLFKEPHQS